MAYGFNDDKSKADLSDWITTYFSKARTAVRDAIYPVGSLYMSTNSTSPAALFGGTWERIQDTFLLAAGSTYAAGTTGGEAEHTLTVEEMPSHTHLWGGKNTGSLLNTGTLYQMPVKGNDLWDPGMKPTGGDKAHNNMPPYLAVYVWKRVS